MRQKNNLCFAAKPVNTASWWGTQHPPDRETGSIFRVTSEACTLNYLNNWMAWQTFAKAFRQNVTNVVTLFNSLLSGGWDVLSFRCCLIPQGSMRCLCRHVQKDGGISFLAHPPRTPASVLWQQSCRSLGRESVWFHPPDASHGPTFYHLVTLTSKPFWLWIVLKYMVKATLIKQLGGIPLKKKKKV